MFQLLLRRLMRKLSDNRLDLLNRLVFWFVVLVMGCGWLNLFI